MSLWDEESSQLGSIVRILKVHSSLQASTASNTQLVAECEHHVLRGASLRLRLARRWPVR